MNLPAIKKPQTRFALEADKLHDWCKYGLSDIQP
jgi:hypothetical protein